MQPQPSEAARLPRASQVAIAIPLAIPLFLAAAANGQMAHEDAGDPYRPGPIPPALSPPVIHALDGPYIHRQVNIHATGMNILGDAANEPSIAFDRTAPNRIAIGWRQFDTISSSFRQAGRAYSRDGGRTWINPGVLDPGVFRSDPVLRADADGRIYYSSLTQNPFRTWLYVSTDGGATFPNVYSSFGDDKQWICIDSSDRPSRGTIYQHWSLIQTQHNFTRSFNQGVNWVPPIWSLPRWGTCDVDRYGVLYQGGYGNPGAMVSIITNAGEPGLVPSLVYRTVPMGSLRYFTGPNPIGLLGQINLAVDRSGGPRDGWVYMLASGALPGDPLDVYFNRSSDGGNTWLPQPIRVNNDLPAPNAWQWLAAMSVSPTGRIDAVWNDTRESQQVNLCRFYYAYSEDGGDTWQGNIPLGPQFNSSVGWPSNNKLGDYCDIVSDRVGAFVAYAATYNNEQDVYFLRINDYDCNGNGIPDTDDLAAQTSADCNGNGIPDECERAAGEPVICSCYANCDGSTQEPILNIADFSCFLQKFAAGDPYANCDGSTQEPVLNVADFSCFLGKFAAGCN